jgi:hypothetical protein
LWFKASPGKGLARPYLDQQAEVELHACDPSYKGGIGRRIVVQGWPQAKT